MQISPSILSADFANLQSELDAIGNADWAHVDVMDAHFVPNLTLGLPVVESLIEVSPVPIDCHLMIEDPDRWAPPYAEAGAKSVTFHIEAAQDPVTLARALRSAGARASMALKPGTPWEPYEELLPELDMVLVMTVEPGFGGQAFMADMMPKVRAVRESVRRYGGEIWIQVDGESPPPRSSSAPTPVPTFSWRDRPSTTPRTPLPTSTACAPWSRATVAAETEGARDAAAMAYWSARAPGSV
ncbi:ribulose-phosphate 3-epimerase [Mobilicoccus caccae]|uniref:Ribulose-phosphate 3-epimerase n=1 Tax=Mobilicoccus caccae TaxID=1859295 RepID=A0ABQ6IS58_9MICO|nr:ribulose-phosphate 3-epimerase [Mobilicoccus caccae]